MSMQLIVSLDLYFPFPSLFNADVLALHDLTSLYLHKCDVKNKLNNNVNTIYNNLFSFFLIQFLMVYSFLKSPIIKFILA